MTSPIATARAILTTGERRRLKRYACAWCEQRLDQDACGAIFEKCSQETIEKRRADCLAAYKPRSGATK